jgi:RNA polymerase sigma-70 factor (ECF subfamily)
MEVEKQTARQLVDRYHDTVFRVAYAACGQQADAENIMQDVFLRYFGRRPQFASDEHAKAWFLRVTMNCCKSHLGSYWRRNVMTSGEYGESVLTSDGSGEPCEGRRTHPGGGGAGGGAGVSAASLAANPEAAAEAAETRQSVLAEVAKLPPKQRVCIHLFYFEERSVAEISRLTGLFESTVKSHLHRARAALKVALKEDDYEF